MPVPPSFGPPERHQLNAASGWLGLGNPGEASGELDRLPASLQGHPDVLELRWEVASRQGQWETALDVAVRLVETAPDRSSGWIHRSYSLHELLRTPEAWEGLRPAADRFPDDTIIPYNLACYACQMGRMDEARVWLDRAVAQGGREAVVAMALKDRDLAPFWPELRGGDQISP